MVALIQLAWVQRVPPRKGIPLPTLVVQQPAANSPPLLTCGECVLVTAPMITTIE